jgi:hypothetical protein
MKHLLFAMFSLSGLIYEVFTPHKPATIEAAMPQIDTLLKETVFELGCINTDLNCIDDHISQLEAKIK